MPRPMPSPHGTNHERQFMSGPVAAYDAAMPPDSDVMQQLSNFLSDKLTPEDLTTVMAMLNGGEAPDDDMASDTKFRRGVGRDYAAGRINSVERDQLLQRGPRTGNGAGFADRYPDAAHIRSL